jgi:hypothetical protein
MKLKYDDYSNYDLIISDIDYTILKVNLLDYYFFSKYSIPLYKIWWRARPFFILLITIYVNLMNKLDIDHFLLNISENQIKVDYKCKSLGKVIFVTNCWPLYFITKGSLLGRPIISTGIIKYLISSYKKEEIFDEIISNNKNKNLIFIGDREHDRYKDYDFIKV